MNIGTENFELVLEEDINILCWTLLSQDNVADFIRVGGVQKLQDGEFIVQVCSTVFQICCYFYNSYQPL